MKGPWIRLGLLGGAAVAIAVGLLWVSSRLAGERERAHGALMPAQDAPDTRGPRRIALERGRRSTEVAVPVRVHDELDAPVAGAEVFLGSAEPARILGATDALGEAVVTLDLRDVFASILVRASGHADERFAVELAEGAEVDVELGPGASIEGVVVRRDGLPMPGVGTVFYQADTRARRAAGGVFGSPSWWCDSVSTTSDGRFRIEGLEPGRRYRLDALVGDHATVEAESVSAVPLSAVSVSAGSRDVLLEVAPLLVARLVVSAPAELAGTVDLRPCLDRFVPGERSCPEPLLRALNLPRSILAAGSLGERRAERTLLFVAVADALGGALATKRTVPVVLEGCVPAQLELTVAPLAALGEPTLLEPTLHEIEWLGPSPSSGRVTLTFEGKSRLWPREREVDPPTSLVQLEFRPEDSGSDECRLVPLPVLGERVEVDGLPTGHFRVRVQIDPPFGPVLLSFDDARARVEVSARSTALAFSVDDSLFAVAEVVPTLGGGRLWGGPLELRITRARLVGDPDSSAYSGSYRLSERLPHRSGLLVPGVYSVIVPELATDEPPDPPRRLPPGEVTRIEVDAARLQHP